MKNFTRSSAVTPEMKKLVTRIISDSQCKQGKHNMFQVRKDLYASGCRERKKHSSEKRTSNVFHKFIADDFYIDSDATIRITQKNTSGY